MSADNERKGFIKKVGERIKYLLTGDLPLFPFNALAPFNQSGQVVEGISFIDSGPDSPHKKATIRYSYSAYPYGAWRDIPIVEIRLLASSFWIKRCKSLIIETVSSHDWEIVSNDDNKYPELQKDIEEFLDYNTGSDQATGFKGLIEQWIDDILDIATASIVKTFAEKYYDEANVLQYYGIPRAHKADYVFQQSVLQQNTPRGKAGGKYPLKEIKAYDTYTFLKQLDIYGETLGYWQHGYSLIPPRFFLDREVMFFIKNPLTYNPYATGQTQSVLEIVKLLIYATDQTQGYFEKGAIPQGILNLNVTQEEYDAFTAEWKNKIQGHPYRLPAVKTSGDGTVKWTPFNLNQKDVIFLDGQDFYARAVMSVYQVPPHELGYTDTVNKSSSEEQTSTFKRKTVRPLMKALQIALNREIVAEFDPKNLVAFQWIYEPDIEEMVKETAMWKERIEIGMNVPDEYRKTKGLEEVWWGKVPPKLLDAGIIDEAGFKQREEERQNMNEQLTDDPKEEEQDNPKDEEEKTLKQLLKEIESLKGYLVQKPLTPEPIVEEKVNHLQKETESEPDAFEGRAEEIKGIIQISEKELEKVFQSYLKEIIIMLDQLPSNFFEQYDALQSAELISNLFNEEKLTEMILPVIAKAYQYGIISINEETAVDKGLFDNIKFITNYAKIVSSKFISNFKEKIKFMVHDQASKLFDYSLIVKNTKTMINDVAKNLISVSAVTISQTAVNYGRINEIQTKGFEAWKFYTMEDERVCEICAPHHLKVYSVNDLSFKPPLHPQCRCLATPTGQKPLDFFSQQQDLVQTLIQNVERGIRPPIAEMTKSMIIMELKGENSLNQLIYKHMFEERKSLRGVASIYGLSRSSIHSFVKECKLEELL